MSIKPLFRLLVITCLIASCSASSAAFKVVEPVDGKLRPLENGYAFANFPSSSSQETFNSQDLAEMFGPEACTGGITDPCEPIAEAAAWARMVNQSRISGQCEGMVVEASQRFNRQEQPSTSQLQKDPEVVHRIFRQFSTQFLQEVVDERDEWAKKSLSEVVSAIADGRMGPRVGAPPRTLVGGCHGCPAFGCGEVGAPFAKRNANVALPASGECPPVDAAQLVLGQWQRCLAAHHTVAAPLVARCIDRPRTGRRCRGLGAGMACPGRRALVPTSGRP